jgi:hypothetical protein
MWRGTCGVAQENGNAVLHGMWRGTYGVAQENGFAVPHGMWSGTYGVAQENGNAIPHGMWRGTYGVAQENGNASDVPSEAPLAASRRIRALAPRSCGESMAVRVAEPGGGRRIS